MESRDELKEIDIENRTCYYFDFSIFFNNQILAQRYLIQRYFIRRKVI